MPYQVGSDKFDYGRKRNVEAAGAPGVALDEKEQIYELRERKVHQVLVVKIQGAGDATTGELPQWVIRLLGYTRALVVDGEVSEDELTQSFGVTKSVCSKIVWQGRRC
jgi:hypothetical protein